MGGLRETFRNPGNFNWLRSFALNFSSLSAMELGVQGACEVGGDIETGFVLNFPGASLGLRASNGTDIEFGFVHPLREPWCWDHCPVPFIDLGVEIGGAHCPCLGGP